MLWVFRVQGNNAPLPADANPAVVASHEHEPGDVGVERRPLKGRATRGGQGHLMLGDRIFSIIRGDQGHLVGVYSPYVVRDGGRETLWPVRSPEVLKAI